jgi:PIN domain nuclease of toxin-antitoxin system
VRLLLDTHTLLWAIDPTLGRLHPDTQDAIEDGANDVLVSAASAWEIGIKHSLGKLKLPSAPEQFIPEHVARASLTWLSVVPAHALRVASLPRHHSDPFDRLLVAQALLEELIVVTADPLFARYGIDVMRA